MRIRKTAKNPRMTKEFLLANAFAYVNSNLAFDTHPFQYLCIRRSIWAISLFISKQHTHKQLLETTKFFSVLWIIFKRSCLSFHWETFLCSPDSRRSSLRHLLPFILFGEVHAMLIFTYSFRCIETFPKKISKTCAALLTFITNYTRSTLKASIIYCMRLIFHLHPQQRCNSKKIISKILNCIRQSGSVGKLVIGL